MYSVRIDSCEVFIDQVEGNRNVINLAYIRDLYVLGQNIIGPVQNRW